jgi:hypothetical protein
MYTQASYLLYKLPLGQRSALLGESIFGSNLVLSD